MELQWPLILFTTFVAWSAGLFGAQGVLALRKGEDGTRGAARRSQLPALVVSVALLAIGGVCVFFHLQHWERIFNGFGHITSGITQELIAIVVMVVLAVVYFLMLRRSETRGTVPAWCAAAAVVVAVLLVAVCGHSYMMSSLPAWDTFLQVLSVVGAALILGPASLALIMALRGDDLAPAGVPLVAGVAVGAVLTVAYAAYLQASGGSYVDVGYYFDPTEPTIAVTDVTEVIAGLAPLLWGGAVAVGAVAPLALAVVAKVKDTPLLWKVCCALIVACGLAGAVCLRVAFYELGYHVYMFF